jgi:hypothetical protein
MTYSAKRANSGGEKLSEGPSDNVMHPVRLCRKFEGNWNYGSGGVNGHWTEVLTPFLIKRLESC